MNKEDIAQLLLEKYNEHVESRAFALFYKDWLGDMHAREEMCDHFMSQEMTVKEIAILLVGSEMWDDFHEQRVTLIDTYYWRERRFDYAGQPVESKLAA